jgi:rhamnulokinase/L-fuculokinase
LEVNASKRGKTVLACDLGASSGRVIAVSYDGKRLFAQEARRFRNVPVLVNGTLYWNILGILAEIKQGIADGAANAPVASVGIDTWGVDFGLLGEDGQLLSGVVHYRDRRTDGYERLYAEVGRDELYLRTGIQEMPLNSIFQIDSLKRAGSEVLRMAKDILPVPDLLNYFLTGCKQSEYTIASTTGLLDANRRDWDRELMGKIGFRPNLFRDIAMPGTRCGAISEEVRRELGIPAVDVVSVAAHDTASAAFAASAVPPCAGLSSGSAVSRQGTVFLSCGTWCLLGVELDEPCTSEQAMRYGFTNEGGVGGRILFMKNIPGTWLVQECVRRWAMSGNSLSYDALDAAAAKVAPFKAVMDVDDPLFVKPEDMPAAIRGHCAGNAQPIPDGEGEHIRCVYEGLAFRFRRTIDEMKGCIGNSCDTIRIIGGGAKSALLCQITADVTRRTVIGGQSEATALGNAAIQLLSCGEFADAGEARLALAASGGNTRYEPGGDAGMIEDAFARYMEMYNGGLSQC